MIHKRHEELLYQAFPWLLGIGVFLASFITSLQPPWKLVSGDYMLWRSDDSVWALLLVVLSGAAATLVRRWIWPLCAVALAGLLIFDIWPPVAVACFYVALRWRRPWTAVLYVAVALLLVIVPIAMATRTLLYSIRFGALLIPLMIVIPYTAGLWVRARRQHIEDLQTNNATLAARARAEERTRIAREMHDAVAHRVALVVLHAGALEMGSDDEDTSQKAELIRVNGREALTELRQLLGMLRAPGEASSAQPLLTKLEKLAEQTSQTGTTVELAVEADLAALPAAMQSSVYRLVQEALTNVVKHATGAPTEVLLRHISGSLEVTIRNGPRPPVRAFSGGKQASSPTKSAAADSLPSSGMGLIGLRERVDLLNGEFEAGPLSDGGFCVSARLPVELDAGQSPGEEGLRQ